jgi:hypothetical protein
MLTPFRTHPYRAVAVAGLVVLSITIIDAAGWQLDRPSYAIAAITREIPSWVGLPLVIFIAASVSSTVGFAFSAIAAAMIFHFVPDNVEAVKIIMVASIAIQTYSVANLYRTISWRACAPFLIGGIAMMLSSCASSIWFFASSEC